MITRPELIRALWELNAAGPPVPCLTLRRPARDAWTANDYDTQTRAAAACAPCTARTICAAFIAQHPKEFGVYAGTTDRDRARDRARRESGESL